MLGLFRFQEPPYSYHCVRGFSSNRTEREAILNNHLGCEDCNLLRDAWHSAVSQFSESVERLRDAHKNGNAYRYSLARSDKELARITVDNARTLLQLHRLERAVPA